MSRLYGYVQIHSERYILGQFNKVFDKYNVYLISHCKLECKIFLLIFFIILEKHS